MKKLLVLSGKGGTGKTTVASSFIAFSNARAFADCDVDAPNLHIVTSLESTPKCSDYYGSKKAKINLDKCEGCRVCIDACKFDAISFREGKCFVNEYSCEGCGVCVRVCKNGAVNLEDDIVGKLTLYDEDRIFSTAELKMGRGNSGMLVSEVKSQMIKAVKGDIPFAVIDGAPGIGCPVIASVSGVDLVLIVAEPSLSGMSDMERVINTATILKTKVAVCVNKFDACVDKANGIEKYCIKNAIPFVGRIPYDKNASKAINEGKCLAEIDCIARDSLKEVYENTIKLLN